MRVCLCSANYVADVSGYSVRPFDWGTCERATIEAFSGEGWEGRFRGLLARVRAMGFEAIEVWQAHMVAARADEAQRALARRLLDAAGVRCASYTSFFSRPNPARETVESAFRVASALGASVIAGGMHRDNAALVDELARQHRVRMAIENHGERPEAIAELLGALTPAQRQSIGTTVDTGIYAGQGIDPVEACRLLAGHILHVHFKDVTAVGAPGKGIARLPDVVAELRRQGYDGYLSVECETFEHDPDPESAESLVRVREWLAGQPCP
jgi:sugar phosphate isomerase/epimerase